MEPKVGVLIPFKEVDGNVRKCIDHCLKIDYDNFDIILLPDYELKEKFPGCRVMPTGPVVPALKRNKAIFKLDYEFFASIDSDAFPDRNWLKNAVPLFRNKRIAAVTGPNLIPPSVSLLEQTAVDIIYSKLGLSSAYYIKKYLNKYVEVREAASSNLILRRSVLLDLKGYHTTFLTGEDTILSFDIRNSGKKVIYAPDVVVYHHRRRLFLPHLARVFEQASDKMLILMKYRRIKDFIYLFPFLFVLFVVFGFIFSFFSPVFRLFFLSALSLYFALVILDSLRLRSLPRALLYIIGLPLTHITYGLGFFDALLFKRHKLKDIFS